MKERSECAKRCRPITYLSHMEKINNKSLYIKGSVCTCTPLHTSLESVDVMDEKTVENTLKQAVMRAGGLCWKLVSPGMDGVPDRICLKAGRVVFVEVKAPGKKPCPLQIRRMNQLRAQGFTCLVVDSVEGIQEVLGALSAA